MATVAAGLYERSDQNGAEALLAKRPIVLGIVYHGARGDALRHCRAHQPGRMRALGRA